MEPRGHEAGCGRTSDVCNVKLTSRLHATGCRRPHCETCRQMQPAHARFSNVQGQGPKAHHDGVRAVPELEPSISHACPEHCCV